MPFDLVFADLNQKLQEKREEKELYNIDDDDESDLNKDKSKLWYTSILGRILMRAQESLLCINDNNE